MTTKVDWRCHTSNLLREILSNPSAAVLAQPLRIFGNLLADVATRAAEINDPELNILMLRLTLYEQGDPGKCPASKFTKLLAAQRKRARAKQETQDAVPCV